MFTNKTVRSALMLLAVSGMLSACSSNSGSGEAAIAPASGSILSQEVTQTASVKVASVTDAEGAAVAMDTSAVLQQLAAIDRATITREAYQGEAGVAERMALDLGDVNGSIVRFHAATDYSNVTVATGGFPATAAAVTHEEGRVTEMLITVEDGRSLNVVLTFIEVTGGGEECSKQDEKCSKQDEPKQDEPKQDEPKQDEPKQDEPKQDQPKQDQPKQDQPKQDQPKQDQPKQDQPKQDQPKQDQPKQDEPKQDQPKQDQPKQDEKKG